MTVLQTDTVLLTAKEKIQKWVEAIHNQGQVNKNFHTRNRTESTPKLNSVEKYSSSSTIIKRQQERQVVKVWRKMCSICKTSLAFVDV